MKSYKIKICDAHNDFLTEFKNNLEKIGYINRISNDKTVEFICGVIWTTKLKDPIRFVNNLKRFVFEKIKTKKVILAIEDLGFINYDNYKAIMQYIIKLKPLYCSLTWNFDNTLGGGALGKNGITKLGREVVKFLEENNILVDTAHMNRKTFKDFVKITKKPIFNSHANINELFVHPRNLTNNQIKAICNSDGLICLSLVGNFISNNKISSYQIAKQIDFFVKKYGFKNLAIGSDFLGTKNLPIDIKNYEDFKFVKKELLEMGYKEIIIDKIFYKNFYDFYRKIREENY